MSAASEPQPGAGFAYVGCFTTEKRRARGDGIHVYAVSAEDGAWSDIQHVPDLVNPSFLVMGAGDRTLYAVHGDQDYASAYARDTRTGRLQPLGKAASGGDNVVHGALDSSGRHFVVANYGTGSVAVLPVAEDGGLADYAQRLMMPGTPGPHRTEQSGSHPHHVVFDASGRFVLVPDKGHDSVCVFAFEAGRGTLELVSMTKSRPGAGPRHGAFHPTLPVYWVLNELDSSITTYRWSAQAGSLEPVQLLPTLPSDFFGASTAAAIVVTPCGRYVFASNRGHDGVAAFAVDAKTGQLEPRGWTQAPGREPRFMTFHGNSLYVASERDDVIGQFAVDARDGRLRDQRRAVSSLSPVSIAFA
ncbi:MAG TPA: lactonase family protein [Candidatus Limnocylindria bacterium]|nr:lactonase family protein [Candidatus Limnocylindria bacterium]